MKLVSKEGEVLASVAIDARKGQPLSAAIDVAGRTIQAPPVELDMTKEELGLAARVRVPNLVNFKVVLEPADIKSLKGLMNKDALTFMVKSLLKG